LLEEMKGERFDVFRAFAQRRQIDLKSVDAIEQIGAESSVRRLPCSCRGWSPR
jgi:hypothetical protein